MSWLQKWVLANIGPEGTAPSVLNQHAHGVSFLYTRHRGPRMAGLALGHPLATCRLNGFPLTLTGLSQQRLWKSLGRAKNVCVYPLATCRLNGFPLTLTGLLQQRLWKSLGRAKSKCVCVHLSTGHLTTISFDYEFKTLLPGATALLAKANVCFP